MISERYANDGVIRRPLNQKQQETLEIVRKKLATWKLESPACPVCKKKKFEVLAEKDRYGLPIQNVICKTCGLVQIRPRPTQKQYTDFYVNDYRELYEGHETPTQHFFSIQYEHGRKIWNYIHNHRSHRITSAIEIGVGAGGILKYFQDQGATVFGVDYGKDYIAYGKKQGVSLKYGDIHTLGTKKADLIIYSHVLEHVLDPVSELKKAKKHLTKDGAIYIEVPGIKNISKDYDGDVLDYLHIAHTYSYTLRTIRAIAAKAGFRVVSGNEMVQALLIPTKKKMIVPSDYEATTKYVRYLERTRTLHKLRAIPRACQRTLVLLVTKTGTLNIARKVYYRLKR